MHQKTILCYGDSNTWGYIPNLNPGIQSIARYSRTERWPGLLQTALGDNYYVVEEGLNGRTTNLDYHIPPDRNGMTYLPSCLYSQAPIDLAILALGANDFKVYFKRQPADIKNGLAELIDIIQTSLYGPNMSAAPKVLIVSVPIVLPIAETFIDENGIKVFEGARKKSQLLVNLYAELAKEKNCFFLDASKEVIPSQIDGGHFDAFAHQQLAKLLDQKIRKIFND